MKIKTKAYSPLSNNTGDIGNGSSIDVEINSYGWVVKNSNRPNSFSIKRPGQPFIKNNGININPKDVFIIEDFMGNTYFINLSGIDKIKFLYLNNSLWIQNSENQRYLVNIFYLTIGAILAFMSLK
jgi:hypothetical protein